MRASYESAIIGDRFGLGLPPTVLARTTSLVPIGFTRLRSNLAGHERARDVPPENAFSFHVMLRPISADLWIGGKHRLKTSVSPGATFLFDLNENPVSQIHTPFDILRFYVSQASLDELAFDNGQRRMPGFSVPCLGAHDRVMHGLAHALLGHVEHPGEHSALFIDHVALAFHAHVTDVYGGTPMPRRVPGALTPWQLRRTLDYVLEHLGGDPTIAQLARECGLSPGYFARAFRQAMGVTPHKWLMRKRAEQAKALLWNGELELAQIAIACGFVDQSHLTRVFARFYGLAPGRWRRLRRPH